jgi:hypothetical protein
MSNQLGTRCLDCRTDTLSTEPGVATEYYMVHDSVWEAAQAPQCVFLCIGCLEARLGRQLHRGDFTDAKINDLSYDRPDMAWWYRSQRLRDRLAAPSPQDGRQLALWQ